MRTGSNPPDINWFRMDTRKFITLYRRKDTTFNDFKWSVSLGLILTKCRKLLKIFVFEVLKKFSSGGMIES